MSLCGLLSVLTSKGRHFCSSESSGHVASGTSYSAVLAEFFKDSLKGRILPLLFDDLWAGKACSRSTMNLEMSDLYPPTQF